MVICLLLSVSNIRIEGKGGGINGNFDKLKAINDEEERMLNDWMGG